MATNSILQDLYAQILHSEEQVKERNSRFKAVNEEIASTQAKTAELRDELKSLQGNIAIQNNKVAEQELQLKWLKEREKVMHTQKQALENTKFELQKKLNSVQDKRQCERESFMGECEEFSSMYNLTGEGKRKRDAAKQKKLEELMKKTVKLKSDIDAIQKEKAAISVLEKKKQQLLTSIKELESRHEEIDKSSQAERDETERLRQEKLKLSEKLKNDPELQRLTAELKKCKEESLSLEGINDTMDQELNELRQHYYQQQLRKQREQRGQLRQQQLHEQHKQQQTRKEPTQSQQWQLQKRPTQFGGTTSRSKDLNKPESQRTVQFAQQTQDKGIQRPLFDESNKQDEAHGSTPSSAATTNSTTERGKGFAKKPRFYY